MMPTNFKINRWIEILALPLIGFAVLWGVMTTKINAQEKKVAELEISLEKLITIQIDIATIKQQIISINEKLK